MLFVGFTVNSYEEERKLLCAQGGDKFTFQF